MMAVVTSIGRYRIIADYSIKLGLRLVARQLWQPSRLDIILLLLQQQDSYDNYTLNSPVVSYRIVGYRPKPMHIHTWIHQLLTSGYRRYVTKSFRWHKAFTNDRNHRTLHRLNLYLQNIL